jgi:DNA-binding HxlR family transcriptional regulator
MRYNQLLESLDGISPSTLADVLKNLQKDRLLRRESHGRTPPYRVEYSITKKGLELIIASSYLVKWMIKSKKR